MEPTFNINKNPAHFLKRKMYITASSFKFSGFRVFFVWMISNSQDSAVFLGVETWRFFWGVLKPGQEKEDEDPTSSTGSLGKGRSNNTTFMVFLWKINMEPKHGGLEDDLPFQFRDFGVLC